MVSSFTKSITISVPHLDFRRYTVDYWALVLIMYSDWKESFTVDVRAVWVMVTFFLLIIFKFYLNFTFYNTIHVLHMRLFTTMVLLATIKSLDAISKVANLWLFATNNARRLSFFNRSNRKNDVCRCRMVFTRRLNSNWPTTILSNF